MKKSVAALLMVGMLYAGDNVHDNDANSALAGLRSEIMEKNNVQLGEDDEHSRLILSMILKSREVLGNEDFMEAGLVKMYINHLETRDDVNRLTDEVASCTASSKRLMGIQ